jgi:hypothetical protein
VATWSKDELRKIAEADDLHISPFREDGVTYGTPTWIWSVAVDEALYVRAYTDRTSAQAAVREGPAITKEPPSSGRGRSTNASMTPTGHYYGSPYLSSM